MDRVYLIDHSGKLFFIEPPNEYIRELIYPNKKIIRISQCQYCFWAITADFEINLYIYQKNNPIQVIESTYENQVIIEI